MLKHWPSTMHGSTRAGGVQQSDSAISWRVASIEWPCQIVPDAGLSSQPFWRSNVSSRHNRSMACGRRLVHTTEQREEHATRALQAGHICTRPSVRPDPYPKTKINLRATDPKGSMDMSLVAYNPLQCTTVQIIGHRAQCAAARYSSLLTLSTFILKLALQHTTTRTRFVRQHCLPRDAPNELPSPAGCLSGPAGAAPNPRAGP